MDIVPAAGQALSVLGSIDTVSRLAQTAQNIGSTSAWLSNLGKRIRGERENLRNLRQRIRQHESRSTPSENRRMAIRNRRGARTTVRRKYYRKPTDSRPSPYVIPKNIPLANCIGKELKNVYVGSSTQQTTTGTTSTVFHCAKTSSTTLMETLIPIARGTSDNERDGRAVCLQWTALKGRVTMTSQAQAAISSLNALHLSILLVLDRQSNGQGFPANGVDTPDDGWDGGYVPVGSIAAPFLPIDPDDKQRYKILKRKDFVMNPYTVVYDGSNFRSQEHSMKFKMFKRYNGLEALFDGSTGAASEIVSNNLFVVIGYFNPGAHGWTIQFSSNTAFTG